LAADELTLLSAPTLLIIRGKDPIDIKINEEAKGLKFILSKTQRIYLKNK
jgi:hypothetical protein